MEYKFNPEEAFTVIKTDIQRFTEKVGTKKVVLGISGGKDSSVIARLASKILGPENVYGVMMPNGVQKDIADARQAIKEAGINSYAIDIANAYNAEIDQLHLNGLRESADTKINLPPRLRTSILFAVAQTVDGIVLCSDNCTEAILGYSTFGGDGFGCYAPLKGLTVTEVIALGDWLGVSENLCHKVPSDGLQDKSDEDRLGMKYADVDNFIRKNEGDDELKAKVLERYQKNKFKSDIIDVPYPELGLPNFVTDMYINDDDMPF